MLAEPLVDHALPGAGTIPVPLNVTSCTPPVSVPLRIQVPLAFPRAVGVKTTVSVSASPGVRVVPSASELVGENSPPLGGLDLVISTAVPPVFLTVNDRVIV